MNDHSKSKHYTICKNENEGSLCIHRQEAT